MLLKNPQPRFEEIYRIYEESFPDVERRTKDGQREVFDNPRYRVRVMEENGEILAFLGYWDLPGCVFLEHLAATERCRGKGYGKLLAEEAVGETGKPVFLEIEPITEENPMTGRRAGFYERLGFYLNTFFYEQMPLKPSDGPIPLWIMSHGKSVTEEEFKPYKKEIYNIVYGVDVFE
ncbi:GNAT family N-acetyltransferase [Clostridium sp. Marseille-P2415]|uniref:GNAT family N-acetyltransferase n=1 Tax=Clostridium sp. Marseille-P2415 TaxID=1805471 RepID=UPI00098851E6|nr:GNAT family N-acetyltransferase [Clostridium sp. Marseille-P2415]